jgi:hypothetical protein
VVWNRETSAGHDLAGGPQGRLKIRECVGCQRFDFFAFFFFATFLAVLFFPTAFRPADDFVFFADLLEDFFAAFFAAVFAAFLAVFFGVFVAGALPA